MPKIFLDPGHGGTDSGAVYKNRFEKEDNLRMAKAVGALLQNEGFEVAYSRTSDVYDTPEQKADKANAAKANAAKADLMVSFHRNSSSSAANGTEVLIYDLGGKKEEIANSLSKKYGKIGFNNRGIKVRPNLVVLNRTSMPAILLELGFIDSDKDNELFDKYFTDIAYQTMLGILEYFGKVPKQVEGSGPAWISKDGRLWYRHADGSFTKNDWEKVGEKWYFFDKDGWIVNGWMKWKDEWYYLKPVSGEMAVGFLIVDGKTYYFQENGMMLTKARLFTPDEKGALR